MFADSMKEIATMTADKVISHNGSPETAYQAWVTATKTLEITTQIMVKTVENIENLSEPEAATLTSCMMGYMIDDLGRALCQLEGMTLTGDVAWQQLKLTIPETVENVVHAFFGTPDKTEN